MGFNTNILRYNMMRDFVGGFASNTYFVFGSSLDTAPTLIDSTASSRIFLEKTIFGKKISGENSDVYYMISRNLWQSGTVYDQYDDAADMSLLNYYVVIDPVSESGDYDVFKCISNNYGAVSTEKPQYNQDIELNHYVLYTADGYAWKYMYSVTSDDVTAYGTTSLFPVIPDSIVEADAVRGINNIVVENPLDNYGYVSQSGTIESVNSVSTTEGYYIIYVHVDSFNPIRGYYNGYTFYTTSSNGVVSRKYIIRDSGLRSGDQQPYVSVEGYTIGDITNPTSTTWNYSILPSVEIIGDGTGASAIANMTDSRITSITMLNPGQGYTRALARITKPTFGFNPEDSQSGDVTCVLRVVISPLGGHGSDPVMELISRNVLISAQFTVADGSTIPTTNSYSKIGIVKNPSFSTSNVSIFDNRILVELASTDQISVGDVATQPETDFSGIVHQVDSINNYVYLTEFNGPYFDQSESSDFYLSNMVSLDSSYPLTTPSGRVEIVTDGVTYPVYQQATGDVIYMSNFDPIQRDDNLSEQFKFIIAF